MKFYITTAIPYVNAKPHIGHALEFVQADVIARFHRLLGDEVLLLSGGDENALKNVQAAKNEGTPVQKFIDRNTELFRQLAIQLGIGEGGRGFDVFQKGSDTTHHYPSSQKLWELCAKNGDIYKKAYEGLYCIGCEAFYALEELDEKGQCFEHPGKKLDKVSEENYFFRLSKYQKQLIELIKNDTLKIVPEKRKNEVLAFLERGLDDISISRSNERAKNWGVPVPNDSKQRIYVWFDALNIYQSGVGFGWDEKTYKKWWPTDVHVIGKGITRFHAVYWPAFLLSAHLALPKTIFVHEYFTVNGQKMSKTLGNVIDPLDLITKYGADPLRYYFLAKFSPFHDGNFSEGEFKKTYNADLANGLGNLISRIAKLCEQNGINEQFDSSKQKLKPEVQKYLDKFEFSQALGYIWRSEIRWGLKWLDQDINNEKPWQIVDKKLLKLKLHVYVSTLRDIAYNLSPFLPQTAKKILDQFNGTIKSRPPLFPRLS